MLISTSPVSLLTLLPWAALWLAGGLGLSTAVFRLRPNETVIVGIAAGWLLQNWLANFLSMVLPVPVGFWLSAGLVFAAGLGAVLRAGRSALVGLRLSVPQVFVFTLLIFFFFNIARGTAIFDDFAHLSTVSLIAAGDFPPHFALDPDVLYGYHHFLLLFSAQLIRLGGLSPWASLDAARALTFGLAVMLSALFAQRLTRSLTGGLLGGLMIAFGSGARWLLLLAPPAVTAWLGRPVQLIGSGFASGETLMEALTSTWAVEGAGPIGFPFAFANGIYPPGVLHGHSANGLTGFVVIFILLLTFNRWRGFAGAGLAAIFLSIWGLLGEAELPAIAAGWGMVALAWAVVHRSLRLPRSLWTWLGIVAAGCVVGLLSGGALTDILLKAVSRSAGQAVETSYQTIGFQVGLPAVVSSHLGVLPMLNPAALLVALAELGPVMLVFPLLVVYGLKAFRLGRWYEAAAAATVVFGLGMLFVQFTGSTGVRNTPRLYVFIPLLAAFAAPLTWMWVLRRTGWVKAAAASLGLTAVFGGLVMGGVIMIAAQRPVYSSFITVLDARMAAAHWNTLEPGALVFDSTPYRAPALVGLPTDSSFTWYRSKPEWDALHRAPDPYALRAAGFRYLYMDNRYWEEISPDLRDALSGACVRVVDEVTDKQGAFRRLLDLENCR